MSEKIEITSKELFEKELELIRNRTRESLDVCPNVDISFKAEIISKIRSEVISCARSLLHNITNKKQKIVGTDGDGVLFRFMETLLPCLQTFYPTAKYDLSDFYFGHEKGKYGRKRRDFLQYIMKTEFLENIPIYDGAVNAINKISDITDIVLASGVEKQNRNKRIINMKSFNVKEQNMFMWVSHNNGSDPKKRLNVKIHSARKFKLKIFFEDNPHNILDLTNEGIVVFYPAWHSYNDPELNVKELELNERAIPFHSWKEVEEMLLL
jgi:hypothetical protein